MSAEHPAQPLGSLSPLGRIALFSHRRRWAVIVLWLLAIPLAIGLTKAFGSDFHADYTVPGSDSARASSLLATHFPGRGGDTVDVVVHADAGVASVEPRIRALLTQLQQVGHVASVQDPIGPGAGGAVSADGRTAIGHLTLDVVNADDVPVAVSKRMVDVAEAADAPGFTVALGGDTIANAQAGAIGSEGLGLIAAAVILLLAFGSVVAAVLPIGVAVVGLGVSSGLVGLLAGLGDTPAWSAQLAAMMGIGVGIDYVLLLVTRHREQLAGGRDVPEAIAATAETAGRSVMVAGTTVVISMLGLFAMGLSYMRGAAMVTIVAVLVVMVAVMTLLPALLAIVGTRIDALRLPLPRRSAAEGMWVRWSGFVQRRAALGAAAGIAILVALMLPLSGLHFGFPDAGNTLQGTQTRTSYDMTTQAFGKGANGPLLVAADLDRPGDRAAVDALASSLSKAAGVASVSPVQLNPAGDAALLSVTPLTSPQDPATDDLVRRLRSQVVPAATAGTGTHAHIGGMTAMSIDSTHDVSKRLPLLIGGVVLLSMLLLLVVFRSVAVAIKAAVMNLLSILAAYGVVALVLEGGWAGKLVGIDTPTPLPSFVPVLMFAILFGLSMDYEVFLLSRIREHWSRTGDNASSVAHGLAGTARVITAAAAIMVAVFGAFVPSHEIMLKVIGVGLASAIFIDATVVRLLLVPAAMQLLGRANWWLPTWLDRLLPELQVEGRPEHHAPIVLPGASGLPGQREQHRVSVDV